MTKNTWLFLLFLCVCCAFAVRGQAQNYVYNTGDKPAADKIIAIVGDKIILQSDLENMLVKQKQQYSSLPPNASCMILEQMLSQNALTLQAEKDSLPISDDEVEQNLEHRINYFISIYGSQQKMEQVLGMSIYQIKDKYRSDIKDIMLAQAEQKKIVDEVKITPTEVEAFFKKIPADSLPFFKSEVEVGQIVINPKPSADVVAYIIGQLNGYRKEALSGGKSFEMLANLYSKDLATGGKILTVDRTQHMYDPQFVAAAFRLKNGEISHVFKSQFGYHIIQMVSREGNIAKVRHILLIPPTTSIDIKKAVNKLDTVRADILAGKINFGEAATKYSDDDNIQSGTKNTGGMFTMPDGSTFMNMNDLDPGIVLLLDSMKIGSLSQPVVYTPNEHMPEQRSVRIVYLKSRSKPHRESLQEDYSRVQAQALKEKQYKALNEWFNKHIPDFYLKVDPEYAQCGDISNWVKAASTRAK
jgi:peptidyl-prolyl cis-trans isomerase SurA